jgi:putative ABC transport system ATP-binding protein
MMTATPLVQADGIVRRDAVHGTILLQPTDFALAGGDRVAVTGPSGSGKSVLLRALALLDPLSAGHVRWRGKAVSRAAIPRYRRAVAYIRQRPALLDGSVEDNLRYPFSLSVYRDARFERGYAEALATRAGRGTGFLERQASELSGGEAQIVALIRVLQLVPDVLLLDEPTASLDPESTVACEALINAWFDDAATPRAWIWVSHDAAQAARVGKRQLIMRAGVLSEKVEEAEEKAEEKAAGTPCAHRDSAESTTRNTAQNGAQNGAKPDIAAGKESTR